LEYYLRDIFLGNKPEGNLPPSSQSSITPPRLPRTLLLHEITSAHNLLLDDELKSCIPIQELYDITKIPISSLSQDIQTLRTKVQSAFQVNHPWKEELVNDEYYFDLTSYAVWKIASNAIPKDYEKRNLFARNVGRRVLDGIISQSSSNSNGGDGDDAVGEHGRLSDKSLDALRSYNSDGSGSTHLTHTVPVIIDILNLFESSGYCSGYRIGENDGINSNNNSKANSAAVVFDNLDDEELSIRGGSVNCLVSIYDPATLGSALQITGEGSRFVPDFVGTTLAAAWERLLNGDDGGGDAMVTYESYFVDPVYRPNPKVSSVLMSRSFVFECNRNVIHPQNFHYPLILFMIEKRISSRMSSCISLRSRGSSTAQQEH
jgi:hypothetical protein